MSSKAKTPYNNSTTPQKGESVKPYIQSYKETFICVSSTRFSLTC